MHENVMEALAFDCCLNEQANLISKSIYHQAALFQHNIMLSQKYATFNFEGKSN